MFSPQDLSQVGINRIDVVGASGDDGQLLEAAIRDHVADDERLEDGIERLLLVVELELPEQLEILHILFGDGVFISLPASALRISAVSEPIHYAASLRVCQCACDGEGEAKPNDRGTRFSKCARDHVDTLIMLLNCSCGCQPNQVA